MIVENTFLFFIFITVQLLGKIMAMPAAVNQNYTSDLLRMAKAAQMRAYMNENKAPCENFYKFACGNWMNTNPASPRRKTSYLDQLQDLYWRKSAEMLKSTSHSDTTLDLKLKDFYESCLSTGKLDRVGLDVILKMVNFKGGWPKLESPQWYEYEYDWLKVVAELRRKLGVNIIIGLNIVPDFEDKDMHRIMIGAPEFDLEREVYMEADEDKENLRHAYTYSVQVQLNRYFPDMSEEWASEVAQQILHMEKSLAVGLPLNKHVTPNQTTRYRYTNDLKQAYGSYVDLNRYLNLIFNQTIYSQVYETPEDYFSNLVDVIKETPKLTLANYTMWKVLQQFELNTASQSKSNRWCVNKVMEYFPDALENMFARNYQTIQMVNQLQSLWADLKKAFRDELLNSDKLVWIGLDTRQRAAEKLEAMDLELPSSNTGYVEEVAKLKIRKLNYYENLINILQWKTTQGLTKLVQRPSDEASKHDVPFYALDANKVKIPVTFLQSRFFWDSNYPHALLYSSLGFLLAQQMLKGFDSRGRKYDKHGHLRSWWDTISEYGFDDRANCFVKQYSEYKFPGWVVKDEKALQNDYIADNGALDITYKAYQQWWTNVANTQLAAQETLPLLEEYTQNQLFFLGFAQLWCADYDLNYPDYEHVPERWRVIGALANFNAFAREYKCEIGVKMNPTQKCTLY
ncbi:neprilysin-4 [Glossina fuscipes]|uniref:Neprilysin-4 n=1 Tax=Glossina fuscipes TaxID=7396 RepID=A0A9C6DYW1_9MUSC|nr:neprilysin-4 [Glossina fuscipes]